jgi:hypothetical protein
MFEPSKFLLINHTLKFFIHRALDYIYNYHNLIMILTN